MGDKKKIFIIIISILIIILITYFSYTNKKELAKGTKDIDWISENVELVKDKSLGKNIYKVYKNSDISIYNLKYQKVITKKIKALFQNSKDEILIIYNPYGTNSLSVNVLFKDNSFEQLKYEITSKSQTFSRKITSKNKNNMYELIGLYPGESNKIKLTIKEDSKTKVYDFKIDLEDIEINATKKLQVENGSSTTKQNSDFFIMLGNETDYQNYIALYDNNGIIRSEIPIKEKTAKDLIIKDKYMYFNISKTEIIKLSNTGEITNIYKTSKYRIESNYQIYNDDLYFFATDITKNTEKNILLEYIPLCAKEENKPLDYLNINSFTIIDNNLFISSKETSSIIKINNIFEEPQIEYIISNDLFWQETPFNNLVLTKKNDFKIHVGQNSFQILKSDEKSIYYVVLLDSNYGNSPTRKDFDYNAIDIKNTNSYQGDNSYYYVYKVDEENKDFELIDSMPLEYSPLYGNCQKLSNYNILVNNASKGIFSEYDKDHNLIRKYTAKVNKNYIEKIIKLSFENYWFSS